MNRKTTILLSLQALFLSTAVGCAEDMSPAEGAEADQDQQEQVDNGEAADAAQAEQGAQNGADAATPQPNANAGTQNGADAAKVDVNPKGNQGNAGNSGKAQPQPDPNLQMPNEEKIDKLVKEQQFTTEDQGTLHQSYDMATKACGEIRATCMKRGHGEASCGKVVDACQGSVLALRERKASKRGLIKWALDVVQDVLGLGPIAFDLVNCVGRFAACVVNPTSFLSPYCAAQLVTCVTNEVILTEKLESIEIVDGDKNSSGPTNP